MGAAGEVMSIVLLDIEGTVCPITFVKETLFPYFLGQLDDVLGKLQFPLDEADPVGQICRGFPADVTENRQSLDKYIRGLVASDTKDAVLKSLQGFVWKRGYDNGDLVAPICDDAIKLIQGGSNKVYIYSSGSVPAQKLLFLHVKGGIDLTPYISGYFDITTSGFKQEAKSYRNILKDIGNPDPASITFYSDHPGEVRAALQAGMQAVVVIREGNAPLTDADRQLSAITTF